MADHILIKTSLLSRGMILSKPVINRANVLLLRSGVVITDRIKAALVEVGVDFVYVSSNTHVSRNKIPKEFDLKLVDNITEDRASVDLSDSVKERVAEGIQYLYSNTESDDFVSETESITDSLIGDINSNNAVAVNVNALKVCDEYTFKHSVDVATMAMVLAKNRGFSDDMIHEIGVAGLLHDIGKSKIPLEILNKSSKLSDYEFKIMKMHTVWGYEIVKNKSLSFRIKRAVLQHHEKMDGSGYPYGLGKGEISTFARIISVVDIYDALVTERPYKVGFSPREAIEMMMSMTNTLDVDVLKSFFKSIILFPVGELVKCSDNKNYVVVENNDDLVLRPRLADCESGSIIDLSDSEYSNLVIV